jgi:uncharacterized protein (DUF924 family)
MSPRPDLHPTIRYRPALRIWFYMPLMHSESLSSHKSMLKLLDEFESDAQERGDDETAKHIAFTKTFELQHSEIIERFGRYPHRNEALGRKDTDEEKIYLEKGGQTFGVGKK